jgi:sugar (pentulose or hexulose) kinase
MQIAWLSKNEPGVFRAADKFLSVPDYISLKLTGRAALDISNAGINQLADIRAAAYDPKILDFAGVAERQLGDILPSGSVIGPLTSEARSLLGLTGNVLLAAGAHDQYAALLGAGVLDAGDVLIGTGTAWVVTALTDHPNFESGFAQSVSALPGKWGSLVALSTGGLCLEWFRNNMACGDPGSDKITYDVINHEAERRAPGMGGLMFFPYFSGAPHSLKDDRSKASFVGLDLSHDRFDMARAVMEGVAFQTAWTIESFIKEYGMRSLKMSGGATKSGVWAGIVADITNHPVSIPSTPDLACVGAAILAGFGCGIFASPEEGYKVLGVKERVVEPDRNSAVIYNKLFPLFKARAAALSEMYGIGQ